jgi:hypothetical protein
MGHVTCMGEMRKVYRTAAGNLESKTGTGKDERMIKLKAA